MQDGSFTNHRLSLGFRVEPFQGRDAEIAGALPTLHTDPMDRMLIGTAICANLTVITVDAIFRDYRVATVW